MDPNITTLPGSNIPIFTTPNGVVYYAGGDDSNCTVSACPIELSVYGYRPSLPASSILIALYGLCIIIQSYLGFRYKRWGFMSLMLLGCIDEIIGYIGRILYYNDPWGDSGFIIQIVLITIGPVFFAAAIYVLLAQIIRFISVEHSRFDPKYVYWTFVPFDILSLILQAVGGAMSSTSDGKSDNGVNIALAGLALQVFTLVVFIALIVDYAIRSRSVWRSARLPMRLKIFVIFLASATLLITARCCYRVYELSGGYNRDSNGLRDETLFIVFESVFVVVAAYCLILAHPGIAFKDGGERLVSTHEFGTEHKNQSQDANGTLPTVADRV